MKPLPEGCVSTDEHERQLTANAELLEQRARDLFVENGGRIGVSAAKECMLAAIRARRAAGELARHREMIEHDRELIEHDRRRLGIERQENRLARRPRLERVA